VTDAVAEEVKASEDLGMFDGVRVLSKKKAPIIGSTKEGFIFKRPLPITIIQTEKGYHIEPQTGEYRSWYPTEEFAVDMYRAVIVDRYRLVLALKQRGVKDRVDELVLEKFHTLDTYIEPDLAVWPDPTVLGKDRIPDPKMWPPLKGK
jgi:hypothetical protein